MFRWASGILIFSNRLTRWLVVRSSSPEEPRLLVEDADLQVERRDGPELVHGAVDPGRGQEQSYPGASKSTPSKTGIPTPAMFPRPARTSATRRGKCPRPEAQAFGLREHGDPRPGLGFEAARFVPRVLPPVLHGADFRLELLLLELERRQVAKVHLEGVPLLLEGALRELEFRHAAAPVFPLRPPSWARSARSGPCGAPSPRARSSPPGFPSRGRARPRAEC